MPPILEFHNAYRWLSNFHNSSVLYEGVRYPTVEHAYQCQKTVSAKERKLILKETFPGKAKQAGRIVTLRPDWDTVKFTVMLDLVRAKFANPELAVKLIATGDAQLVEGNTWGDTLWGVCKGSGENHLGKILMQVRSELIKAA